MVLIIFLKNTTENFLNNKSIKTLKCMKLTEKDIMKIKKEIYNGNKNVIEYIGTIAKEKGLSNEEIIKCLE